MKNNSHFKAANRHHTGHVLAHRHTSYPTLVMIVLCLGVFLASWTRYVTASTITLGNNYTVNASVPGPAPTMAAVIDTPQEGTTFTDLPITVGGTCPLDTYINLYRNGAYSGTALCQPTGRFSIQTGLFVGVNQLTVRVYSQTDVPGPLSDPVSVIYAPPQPPPTGGKTTLSSGGTTSSSGAKSKSTSSSGSLLAEPLIFKTIFKYQGHYTGESSTWQLELEGGTAPYAIGIDWGDGEHDLISRPRPGVFSIDHKYNKQGGYKGSYIIKFSATDINGNETFLQVITIINDPPTAAATNKKPQIGFGNITPGYLKSLVMYVWPSYFLVLLMLASFWLGERREYKQLKPRLKKLRRAGS